MRGLASCIASALIATFALGFAVPSARASTTTVQCSASDPGGTPGLQTTLNNTGEGDTVLIDGFCTGAFTLPQYEGSFVGGYTIEGELGTQSGFDGEGSAQAAALLSGEVDGSSVNDPTTLENLTFRNAVTPSGDFAVTSALAVSLTSGVLTLSDDTFTNNTSDNPSGGTEQVTVDGTYPECTSESSSLVVEGSTFTHDALTINSGGGSGGGGLAIYDACPFDPLTLSKDTFSDDSVTAESESAYGGGLFIGSADPAATVTQTGDAFDSDSIGASGTPSNYGGGGEFLNTTQLHSADDAFTNDSIPGASGSNVSGGGGLGFLSDQCGGDVPQETLTDDVVVGNEISDVTGDNPGDAQGAAIASTAAHGSNCTADTSPVELFDSTVTANSVTAGGSGAVSGIAVVGAELRLENSILYGDGGGPESSGSAFAMYSDFCGATLLFSGGDMCANPQLAGTLGIQETASSPTIDAGQAESVPSGLTTDFFGNPREQRTSPSCAPNTAAVDIGAAEYVPTCPIAPVTPTVGVASQTHSKWIEGNGAATISTAHHKRHTSSLPVGTEFSFSINEEADVTVTFTARVRGRRVRGTCVALTKHNRHKSGCPRNVTAGTLNFANVAAGPANVSFDGVISPSKKLQPGNYTITIKATAAGNTSIPATLTFTIAKPSQQGHPRVRQRGLGN